MQIDFRNEWLSGLGQRLGMPTLAFDAAGLCQLSLDDELAVTIYKPSDSESLVLFGQLPVSDLSSEVIQQMLIENRNHSKYNAPVLSLSDNLDVIEVHLKFNQTELEATEDAIGLLIGNLEYWRTSLNIAT